MYFGNSNVSIGVKDGELPNTREVTVKFTMDSDKDAMDKLFLGLKENKCKVCGASGAFKSWRLIEMYKGTRDAFEYFECPECETLQIKTFPPDIGKYYAGNYYSFETPKMPPPLPNVPRDYRRVLDVGCGSGRYESKAPTE